MKKNGSDKKCLYCGEEFYVPAWDKKRVEPILAKSIQTIRGLQPRRTLTKQGD
jgi:hypothetical protein